MPRFTEQFIQQVQQATDIVELIGQYVALKKRGKEFVGLCPFHDDHAPSMCVSPTKQIFKCFACGAGGTAANFLMLHEKMAFPEAIRALAQRANIPLPATGPQRGAPGAASKNDLLRVTDFAARFYADQLWSPAGRAALEYARGRGLTDESVRRFSIGWAPDAWDALLTAARRQRVSDAHLLAAGLITRRDDGSGCYDRFRNRLMFPICEPGGGVIAFGGRALSPEERAKYLNSPETILFDKSSQLYGLNWSRQAISSSGQAIVVEGYLDAIMPMQAGIENIVATMGTSLTDRHVRLLGRFAREVILLFDADAAGAAATQRALEVFLTQQFQVRVATVPAGKDPCDYVLAEGADAFRGLVQQAPDALQYAWNRCRQAYGAGDSLADRGRIIDEFLRLVAGSESYGAIDEIRRGQLAQHIGHMLNIPPADLHRHMQRLTRQIPRRAAARGGAQSVPAPGARAEREVLEVLLNCPELFPSAAERVGPTDFGEPDLRAVAGRVWALGERGRLSIEEVAGCEELAEMGALIADLVTRGERRGNYEATLSGAVRDMEYRRERKGLSDVKAGGLDAQALQAIHEAHRQADPRRRPKII